MAVKAVEHPAVTGEDPPEILDRPAAFGGGKNIRSGVLLEKDRGNRR